MIKEICKVLAGKFYWEFYRHKLHLDTSKVVVLLSGENEEVDKYAMLYLDNIIERKRAKSAVVFVMDDTVMAEAKKCLDSKYPVKLLKIRRNIIDSIYKLYMMDRFYPNFFWTFTDYTKSNLLGRFIREEGISAEEAVCLAIYNFRRIPGKR